jgi:peptide/nickel transport system substrate-binding protein
MFKKIKFKKIVNFLILLILTFNIFLISGCIDDSEYIDIKADYEIFIGMTNNISGFYPWMPTRDTTTLAVNVNLFNYLAEMDPVTFKFVPALAESWNNPDNVTWRFFLRRDVKFHNGYNFTAEDVKFTIEYMKNYNYYKEELEPISEIIILDNYTIDIITDKPYPMLLYKFGTLFIISKNYMKEIENTNETWPIGTGAYKLSDYEPGNHITLERFNDYWKGKSEVKKVTFKKMNSSEELKNALINGDIDVIPLSIDYVDEIKNTEGLDVKSVQTPGVIYISFDFRENDSYAFKESENPVSDLKVRKAMYHAINVESIIDKYLNGSATPTSQFITSHTFGYNPNISRLPYDLDLARTLMIEAGFEDGFTIGLDIPDSSKWLNISNDIANQLSEIKINITLNPQPQFEYYSTLYYRNTSLYITGWSPIDAESTIKLLLHTPNIEESLGIWNYGNYSNPEIDQLCEILTNTMIINERKELIQEIFSIAASDVAWIPLFSNKAFYGTIENIIWNPRPSLFIWVEEISFKN